MLTLDWPEIARKAHDQPWARATVEALRTAYDEHRKLWPHDPPIARSEWFHHYFCGNCGVALGFEFTEPREHVCPTCGKRHEGEPWDGAWRTCLHGSIAVNLERAALLARLHPEREDYRRYVREVILFYAEHYADYEVHGEHAGQGRILPQCLDEAIFVIAIGRALSFGRGLGWFSAGEESTIGEHFFRPAAALLQPQITQTHNIHAWMDSALIVAGAYLRDESLVDFAIEGEHGWKNQLAKGVNDDGFWFEGAMTYHFYTFNALFAGAWAAAEHGRDLFATPKLFQMLEAPLGLVYPDGVFPAHNDCWIDVKLIDAAGLYEVVSRLRPEFANTLGWLYPRDHERPVCAPLSSVVNRLQTPRTAFARNSVAALLFGQPDLPHGTPPPRASRLFRASGIGILENEHVRVCLRFTPDAKGHDHCDKLGLDVFAGGVPISADLGTTGYAAKINQFYRSPAAHNMVVVNGERQQHSNGELVDWNAGALTASANHALPGVALQRRITLAAEGWTDSFTVDSREEATLDWVFHSRGEITTSVLLEEVASPGDRNGYEYLTQVASASCETDWRATWNSPADALTVSFRGERGTQIFTGRCPDHPATSMLGILIVRRRTTHTVFDASFRFTANGA